MSVSDFIMNRRSVGNLTHPAPDDNEIEIAIRCAMSAPDHKNLRPWQFVVLKDAARVRFGQVLAKAACMAAALSDDERERILAMPLRAPMIIMVATQYQFHPKVPAFEQLLSAGAATQNLILSLNDQGYGAVWRTGDLINHALVKEFFGVEPKDTIVAFVYVGRTDVQMPPRDFNTSDFWRIET